MINAFSKIKISLHVADKKRFDMQLGGYWVLGFLIEGRLSLGSFKTAKVSRFAFTSMG